jgi:hypothetical protein
LHVINILIDRQFAQSFAQAAHLHAESPSRIYWPHTIRPDKLCKRQKRQRFRPYGAQCRVHDTALGRDRLAKPSVQETTLSSTKQIGAPLEAMMDPKFRYASLTLSIKPALRFVEDHDT